LLVRRDGDSARRVRAVVQIAARGFPICSVRWSMEWRALVRATARDARGSALARR
jgi:hypothetical protein